MSIRELFRGEQDARNVKPTGSNTRVTMPQGEGYVDVRLINPHEAKRWNSFPFVRSYQHFLGGSVLTSPNTKDPATGYLTGPDPIVAASRKYWSRYQSAKKLGENTDDEYKRAKALTPSPRYTWLAVEVANPDQGVKLLTVSENLHNQIVDLIAGNPALGDEGAGDVFDPGIGSTLRVVKSKGNGGFFAFDKSKFLGESAFGTPVQHAAWVESCPDLNTLNPPATVAELQAALDEILGTATPVVTPSAPVSAASESFGDDEFYAKLRGSI